MRKGKARKASLCSPLLESGKQGSIPVRKSARIMFLTLDGFYRSGRCGPQIMEGKYSIPGRLILNRHKRKWS